jgi:superfamily II DNA/RNA helicase
LLLLPLLPTLAAACRACHVVVGTTGRILSLIQRGTLHTSSVRILVLDEADKLLGGAPCRQLSALTCPLACLRPAAWC